VNLDERYRTSRQLAVVKCTACRRVATEIRESEGVLGSGRPLYDERHLGIPAAESMTWIEGEWPATRFNALLHECDRHGVLDVGPDQVRLAVARAKRSGELERVHGSPLPVR
jgi:hypothetical protein